MSAARLALPLMAAAILAACSSLPKPAYPIADAPLALSREQATSAEIHSIRAEARVEQRAKQGRVRGTVLMFVERGERVRFDVMTQFGPVAILTGDRERFAYADFRESRYLTGPTCPKNIARLLGVPLSVDETSRFLLGGTPRIEAAQSRIAWDGDLGAYRVTLSGKDGARQDLWLAVYEADRKAPAAQQRLYLVRSELHAPNGHLQWRVSYDDHEAVKLGTSTVLAPFRVHVEQAGSDTMIHFKQIKLDPEIPEGAFTQEPRPGMKIEEALCD
jgi:outer membrane lipoprotein-sorting protein